MVSEAGFGMWGLAGWTGSDDAESMTSLQRPVPLGCMSLDTAWAHGDGRPFEDDATLVVVKRAEAPD